MNRWLARLAFSFLILAGLLFWEGYKLLTRPTGAPPTWRAWLYFLAAGLSVGLSAKGMRERHRQFDDEGR
jgi:hypothetical protein